MQGRLLYVTMVGNNRARGKKNGHSNYKLTMQPNMLRANFVSRKAVGKTIILCRSKPKLVQYSIHTLMRKWYYISKILNLISQLSNCKRLEYIIPVK